MTDVFLSYQRGDRDKAEVLARALAARGLDVWWDVELLPGERFADEIALVIARAKAVVVLWSQGAVESRWVRAEARLALDRDILIPARLHDVAPPLPFNDLHTADLTGWEGGSDDPGLTRLVDAVARAAGVGDGVEAEPRAAETGETSEKLHGHDEEARLWAAVSTQSPQSAREYRLYLERHPDGLFAELAKLRLKELGQRRIPGPKALQAGASAVVALIGGVFGLVVAWPQVLEVLRPEAEPGVSAPEQEAHAAAVPEGERAPATDLPDCEESGPLTPCRDRLADGAACGWCPEMVLLEAGHFLLRGTASNPKETGEGPFAIPALAVARYETTVAEFRAFAERTGYEAEGCAVFKAKSLSSFQPWSNWREPGFQQGYSHPVVCVSKRDAEAYTAWLSDITGQVYRLPTAAEWEYAARAGRTTAYPLGDELRQDDANFGYKNLGTKPGGRYPANAWGLYDVAGNAAEWTGTCEATELRKGVECQVRGGGWEDGHLVLDPGFDLAWLDDERKNDRGFRVVRLRSTPQD